MTVATREEVVDAEIVEDELTASQARELTDRIRITLDGLWDLVIEAFNGRAHAALGYSSWDAYCNAEFGSNRIKIPREERQETVRSLREAGLSNRAIASATGLGYGTVHRESARDPNGSRGPSVGTDGKTYPAPANVNTTTGEIIDRPQQISSEERVRRAEATYERLRNEGIIPPPPTDEELKQIARDLIGNKPREPRHLTPEDKFAKALNAVGAAIRINHGVNEALLDDDGWSVLQALGLR